MVDVSSAYGIAVAVTGAMAYVTVLPTPPTLPGSYSTEFPDVFTGCYPGADKFGFREQLKPGEVGPQFAG